MKFFAFTALILAAFQTGVRAATTPQEPPTCGLLCIQEETLQSTCQLTNVTCICTNVELTEKISLCVRANCTVRESLALQSYSKHSCGAPSRNRILLSWVPGISFLVVGLVGFGLRVMARVFVRTQTWGPDDWVMLLAVLMMIPLNSISIPISRAGLGRDIWTLPPDNITDFLYFFFWEELLYLGALPVTKISILLFYLKVFPGRNIRLGCWILIGLNTAYFITFELISIFQCNPIEGAWRAWDKEFPAKCNNINMQGWMAAILNIVLDVATLCLPLRELYKLSLSRMKKIQIMLMFSVGFFVTIVSIVRLQSLASYATTSNVTQDYVEVGYWSVIEVPVGILCACMPAIRSLFGLIFPKVFGTTHRSKSEYANISEGKQVSSSQKSTSKALSRGQSVRVSETPNNTSTMELTDMRFDHHHERHSSEKLPVTPREPV
ncbi:hypothetical protein N0V84_009699 [Fusarium piperis]|uniref:CFEM domain-containing protein n=1 Tax=Fusarium piperis TaxID=1435070 RepID=A0A9W8W5V2_9HYPO|nr:hypothetical protein N0V84_009699 [Fusarium piperis]